MIRDELSDLAKDSALEAGDEVKKKFEDIKNVDFKGEYDLVTESDLLSEDIIVSNIKKDYPEHDIVTEESDLEQHGSEYTWYIDPISGTTNYAHGMPIFSISIGLVRDGDLILGVVYLPILDDLFTAVEGEGAYLNGEEITVSSTPKMKDSLVSTAFGYDIEEREENLELFQKVLPKVQGIRRCGSVAVDMSYVACGRLDGLWAIHMKPWDMAAGILIVEEAGGKATAVDSSEVRLQEGEALVTNGKINEEFAEILS